MYLVLAINSYYGQLVCLSTDGSFPLIHQITICFCSRLPFMRRMTDLSECTAVMLFYLCYIQLHWSCLLYDPHPTCMCVRT